MKDLEKTLQTNQGKIAVFKQIRQSIIEITDGVLNQSILEYDINCSFGNLVTRMKSISDILQELEDKKQ